MEMKFFHCAREREGEDREDMIELGTQKVQNKIQREEEMHRRKELTREENFPSHEIEKGGEKGRYERRKKRTRKKIKRKVSSSSPLHVRTLRREGRGRRGESADEREKGGGGIHAHA